ncbi:MAG: hypothetical protein PHT44_02435 [Candidatus Portnoybacteria bacterium]|nr:hypothetical protein [Candidatus Portnoybacteria bacterium]MDD4982398.1 hypothetical protein [Candidatus Portnoybacteria bacterium]
MSGSKYISGEQKSGLSAEEMRDLDNKVEDMVGKIDRLNGNKLEFKAEMALKNKFISLAQEKELFDFVRDNSALLDRYANGERTEDLLSGLENYYQALERKRNEIFFDPNFVDKKEKTENPGEFKGEISLLKKKTKKLRDVREADALEAAKNEAGGEKTKEGKKEKIILPDKKKELVNRLEGAFKQLYDFLNNKKDAPKELYDLIARTESELRGVIHSGEVSGIAEKMKEKYKADERGKKENEKEERKAQEKKENASEGREKKTDSRITEDKTQEEINEILEDKMHPTARPYAADETGLSAEREIEPEEHPLGERKNYGKDEEKEIYGLEKVQEANRKAEKEQAEAALDKARENFVAAELAKERAEKEENKLTGLRARIKEFIVGGFTSFEGDKTRVPVRQENIGGAQAEAAQARENFSKAQESLKGSLKAYRDGEIAWKTAELKAAGKSDENIKEELEKYAKDILLAVTLREAAKIDSLKSDKQIEQMGAARRYMNEKAEEFTDWYKKLPVKYKMAVSAGLFVGGLAGGLVGSTAIVSAAFAGQAALRVLGGSMMTAGAEQLIKRSQEKSAEKKLSKEFGGKFLEALKNQNGELDDKLFELIKAKESEKNRRFVLAGTLGALVGSGALAQAVRNGINSGFGQEMIEKIKAAAEKTIDFAKHPLTGGFDLEKEALRETGYGEMKSHLPGNVPKSGMPILGGDAVNPEILPSPGGAKAGEEIFNLKIGSRGPEGAIIDNFRAKPDVAKAFGWDGKTDINKWAGTRAHQLWLKSAEGELAKPGMAENLVKHGFTANAEGYAKAMRHLGRGAFVELDGQGHMHLSDKATFLRAASSGVPDLTAKEHILNGALDNAGPADEKIKKIVSRLVEPNILTEETFKAAAKVPLGKILDAIPPEAYEDKYALSRFWHEAKLSQLNLPGSSWLGLTYSDYTKYAEMAKFLRNSIGKQGIGGVKNMTVGEFFNKYMENADKEIAADFNQGHLENK